MAKIRTLIVDDERLARKRVRRLLQTDPDIEIVGECGDAAEAVRAIHELAPQLLFLDVQMPGGDGFQVLEQAGPAEKLPVVIFVTAHDTHALRAFEVHAQDYLLKPFDRPRFQKALRQAKTQVERRSSAEVSRQLLALLEDLQSERKFLQRLVIKSGGRVIFLKTEDIDWIEAADNYVRLHVGAEAHLLRETMNSIESQIDGQKFLRIHRSTIVNVDRIEQLQPWFRGDYQVVLKDGTQLTLSRSYRERVQNLVGKWF